MSITNVGITKPWNEGTVSADAEIADDGAVQNKPSLRDCLIGYWKMNQDLWNGTADEVIDSSDNENHGVAVGSPPTTSAGFNGTHRGDFDGTNDYIRVPTISGISGTEGTILLWLNLDVDDGGFNWVYQLTPFTTTHTTTGIIVSLDMRAGEKNYRIIAAVDGTVQWDWHSADGAAILGTNHSFEISHDGTSPVFYLNGVDITAAGTFTVSTDLTVWYDDWIGATTPISDLIMAAVISTSSILEPFNGKEWGVVMLDRVMTAGERTVLYADGSGGFIEDVGLFSTSAQTCETDTYTIDEDFDSDEIFVKLDRTPAAATEIKVYVKQDGGAFGAAINVDVTPIAGETGWFKLVAGTAFSGHSTVSFKVELNSPGTDTQLRILVMKVNGITISGGGP